MGALPACGRAASLHSGRSAAMAALPRALRREGEALHLATGRRYLEKGVKEVPTDAPSRP